MAYQDALLALADPTRRSILQRLRRGPLAVGKIASRLPVSRPAVSQHLRVLEGARLVNVRRDGTRRLYGIEVAHDLNHLGQIVTTMAKQYDAAVGPWKAYLGVLTR
jgi:DNA-binding transcriptional ArsR family regulator